MNISKTKTDILRITGSMREAEEKASAMEEKLQMAVSHFEKQNKKLDLILFIFPYKAGFLYDKIKQLCDMKYNLVTQCCLKVKAFLSLILTFLDNLLSLGNDLQDGQAQHPEHRQHLPQDQLQAGRDQPRVVLQVQAGDAQETCHGHGG